MHVMIMPISRLQLRPTFLPGLIGAALCLVGGAGADTPAPLALLPFFADPPMYRLSASGTGSNRPDSQDL